MAQRMQHTFPKVPVPNLVSPLPIAGLLLFAFQRQNLVNDELIQLQPFKLASPSCFWPHKPAAAVGFRLPPFVGPAAAAAAGPVGLAGSFGAFWSNALSSHKHKLFDF